MSSHAPSAGGACSGPSSKAPISRVTARAYRIPTSPPEADGTIDWDHTVLIVATIEAGGKTGLGYTYDAPAAVQIIQSPLAGLLEGQNAHDIPACWHAMRRAVRNIGRPGIASCAIAALDIALWDLKAKLLDLPLLLLLGEARPTIEAYGSGGFTTSGPDEIAREFGSWTEQNIRRMKMKIGRDRAADSKRIEAALEALPANGELFVDANGAYHPKEALALAMEWRESPVTWFEEPVSSQDVRGLVFLRERMPSRLHVAAGEYSYDLDDSRVLLEQEAVDVLQVDATRAQGITGFTKAAALCEAFHRPLSAHTAPALHAALCCHAQPAIHLEYFHDHVRIESMLFDGAPELRDGRLIPNRERPGLGLTLKEEDAERYLM